MAKLLGQYERSIERIGLIPSDGGRFEVTVNGELIYSKLATGRHLEEDELLGLISDFMDGHG
jgi:selenoprotein W-related protein